MSRWVLNKKALKTLLALYSIWLPNNWKEGRVLQAINMRWEWWYMNGYVVPCRLLERIARLRDST